MNNKAKSRFNMLKKLKIKKFSCQIMLIISALIIYILPASAQKIPFKDMKETSQVIALASCGRWETIKQEQGITLRSRWLTFGDTLKTREISSRFVVNADMQSVLASLVEPDRFRAWNDEVRSVKILKRSSSSWITHIVYDIPQPFSQQDLVVMHEMKTEGRRILVHMYAVPDYIAPLQNVNRQRLYFGQWEIRALNRTHAEIRFSAFSFSKTNIPRFIRDPIIQNKLLHSFIRLKDQLSHTTEVVAF